VASGLFVRCCARHGHRPIAVLRADAGAFSDSEIELLKTFADQAVSPSKMSACSGARGAQSRPTVALEQKTATGEILRVISSSPTNVQPVFDAIASSATRLCDGLFGLVFRFRWRDDHVGRDYGSCWSALRLFGPRIPHLPVASSVAARAILERRVIAIADAQSGTEYPHVAERPRRSATTVSFQSPMLRGDAAIGAINVRSRGGHPFTIHRSICSRVADQAVIGIEKRSASSRSWRRATTT